MYTNIIIKNESELLLPDHALKSAKELMRELQVLMQEYKCRLIIPRAVYDYRFTIHNIYRIFKSSTTTQLVKHYKNIFTNKCG